MPKKSKLTEQDQSTFRAAIGKVKPMQHTKISMAPLPPKRRKHEPEPTEDDVYYDGLSDYDKLPPVSSEEILQYATPSISHKILRNLRNGKYNIEATLDLHGMTVDEARNALSYFILKCRRNSIRHVLIIHGKGRLNNMPVLKNKLNHWLRQTEHVLAFCSATIRDGRSGSLYVLLKTQREENSN